MCLFLIFAPRRPPGRDSPLQRLARKVCNALFQENEPSQETAFAHSHYAPQPVKDNDELAGLSNMLWDVKVEQDQMEVDKVRPE